MSTPPPLQRQQPAWKPYVLGGAFSFLPFVALGFATVFLLPKLEEVWNRAGLRGKNVQWLMDLSGLFSNHFYVILILVALALFFLELRFKRWSLYRGTAIAIVVIMFNTAVLVSLLAACTSALIAAPMLAHVR
jgi:hypothetical protein